MPTKQQLDRSKARRTAKKALCSSCGEEKPWEDFPKCPSRRPFGLASNCLDCDTLRKRKQSLAKYRSMDLKSRSMENRRRNLRKFGISENDYSLMFHKQNGTCAICKKAETDVHPKSKKPQRLAIDHCHATGKIRGLLCAKCNKGLGSFKDSIESLTNAVLYLIKNS